MNSDLKVKKSSGGKEKERLTESTKRTNSKK